MILNPGYEILGKVSETTFFMHKEKHKINEDFGESFRANQIRCKLWLTEELSMIGTSWGRVLVLGSWNAVLLYELMKRYGTVSHWTFIDSNTNVHNDRDIYWCTADLGWITGHSYIIYGPLSNRATTLMFEGVPNYPDYGRFWDVVDKSYCQIIILQQRTDISERMVVYALPMKCKLALGA